MNIYCVERCRKGEASSLLFSYREYYLEEQVARNKYDKLFANQHWGDYEYRFEVLSVSEERSLTVASVNYGKTGS